MEGEMFISETIPEREITRYYSDREVEDEFQRVCVTLGLFGKKISLYDVLMGWWERKSNRDLVDFIDDARSTKRIVELGVGTGYLLRILAEAFPRSEIIGVDYCSGMLDIAADYMIARGHPPHAIQRGTSEKEIFVRASARISS